MLWRFYRLFLAYYRLSSQAVCEMSVGRDKYRDFHDYPDSAEKAPMHFYTYKCERCAKEFVI